MIDVERLQSLIRNEDIQIEDMQQEIASVVKRAIKFTMGEVSVNRAIAVSISSHLAEKGYRIVSQEKLQEVPFCMFGSSLIDLAIYHPIKYYSKSTVYALTTGTYDHEEDNQVNVHRLVEEAAIDATSKPKKPCQLLAGMLLLASELTKTASSDSKVVECVIYGISTNLPPKHTSRTGHTELYKLVLNYKNCQYTLQRLVSRSNPEESLKSCMRILVLFNRTYNIAKPVYDKY